MVRISKYTLKLKESIAHDKVKCLGAKWWVTDEEIEALGQSFQPGDIVLVSYYFDKYYGEVVSSKDSDGEYLVSNGEEEEYIDERDLTMIAPKGNRVD